MATDKTATFNVKVETKSDAKQGADELETYRAAIVKSQNAVKDYQASLRLLRGSSDEVKKAKADLKVKIDAERDAISRNNLALIKAGTSFDKLQKKVKDNTKEQKSFTAVLKQIGGPAGEASEKISGMGEALAGMTSPAGLTAVAIGLVTIAIAALVAGTIAAVIGLAKFSVESANTLRAMNLMREAATGSAANARALGHEVDFLADRLATPRAKLNELATSLAKTLGQSKVSGQGIEDTFEAVAGASEAMGDETGRALQSIIDRGKLFGRTGLGRFELQSHGIKFEDVAGNLARNLKIGMKQAQIALQAGIVPVDAMAKALKDTVNARFGEVNAKKLLDLDVIALKFKENLQGLFRTFAESKGFQRFLESMKSLGDMFSDTTSTGHTLMVAMSAFGEVIGNLVAASLPTLTHLIKEGVNLSLRFGLVLLDLADKMYDFVHSADGIALINDLITGTKAILITLGAVAAATVLAIVGGVQMIGMAIREVGMAWDFIKEIFNKIAAIDFSAVGRGILEGIVNGLLAGWDLLKGAVVGTANRIKDTFKDVLGIHSPSTVGHDLGYRFPQGVAGGVREGSTEVEAATAAMVAVPAAGAQNAPPGTSQSSPGGAPGAAAGGVGPVSVNFVFHGVQNAEQAVELIKSESVLEKYTHALEILARAQGYPTSKPVGA